MRATTISKIEGLDSATLAETYKKVRAALGDRIEGGHVPGWGPEDGGAWLTTATYKLHLAFYHARSDLKKKSLLEVFYFGEIPQEDLSLIVASLPNSEGRVTR